jgi:nucleolar protein 53
MNDLIRIATVIDNATPYFIFCSSTCRGKISERTDDKLFMIDVKGDDRVKRQLAKDKPLYIEKILQSRSAIPAVGSRLFSLPKASPKAKGKESKANNAKIEKLAKRKLAQTEPTKPAKKSKGTAYDVWADEGKEKGSDQINFINARR